jgi:Tfp pilus assembly protein PilV
MRLARGTSIIEFLAAFAVITSGMMAVMGLVLSNRVLAQANVDSLIAANLAREGLELIKQMRDSNWLAGQPFDAGEIGIRNDGTFLWTGDPAEVPFFDHTASAFTHVNTDIVVLSGASAGFMANRNIGASVDGAPTPFKRLVTLTAICDDPVAGGTAYSFSADQNCPSTPRVGIRVKAEVRWTRNGQHAFIMYSDLYAWR